LDTNIDIEANLMNKKNYQFLLISSILILMTMPFSTSLAHDAKDEIPQTPVTVHSVYIPVVVNSSGGRANPEDGIIINYQSLSLFDSIPDSYIQAASQLKLLFRHASVGYNISNGLDCLMNKVQPRPSSCDRYLLPNQVVYNPKYNRNNWVFEFHMPPPAQNPAWWDKYYLFQDRVDGLGPNEDYDVVGFKFGYVDGYPGSLIDDLFFNNVPDDPYPSIEDMEALEARHPDKTIMYWTMGLSRLTYIDSQSFNQQMRNYASSHHKVLVDIASIESHQPDGTPCYDNAGQGIEAICQDYTTEVNGGHLNALGMQRMAKALWVLMARIAGWNGQP
jgi:hypothetical protein